MRSRSSANSSTAPPGRLARDVLFVAVMHTRRLPASSAAALVAVAVLGGALAVGGAGCITHLPLRTTAHLGIHWQPSYAQALDEAARSHKPLLVLLVAGQIDGLC